MVVKIAFAAGREDDIDRVIHAAGHDRLDAGAIGPAAEDVGCAGDEWRLARPLVGLLGEGSLAPVDPAVGPGYGPCRSLAQPVSVLPWNHSTRWSATPSPSVSVSFQMLGGAATYSEPP